MSNIKIVYNCVDCGLEVLCGVIGIIAGIQQSSGLRNRSVDRRIISRLELESGNGAHYIVRIFIDIRLLVGRVIPSYAVDGGVDGAYRQRRVRSKVSRYRSYGVVDCRIIRRAYYKSVDSRLQYRYVAVDR